MMRPWKMLAVLCCVGAATGCGAEATDAMLGTTESDASSQDVKLQPDTGGTSDAVADTAPDVPPEVVQDIAPELPPPDVQPDIVKDTAPELPPPDVQPEVVQDVPPDPCIAKLKTFDETRTKALACSSPFDCWKPAPMSSSCPDCTQFADGVVPEAQGLVDLAADLKKSGCGGTCSTACPDMTKTVGVCSGGACATKELSCKELETAATAALAQGAKCSKDSDCVFKVSNTLGCGCPTFVNVTTMGPAKPLFNYMIMLVKAYKAKVCTADTSCACPDPQGAKCVAGICVAQ